ncbi:MAG TPA: undecaprenyldiphospho-muramoylpentapeptide beta-N-acetylglucosaminyltransferase [Flavobacteriaceae bacterium]|nr:undecaprenyldiphospho-muramoylpentapeptide beta-N-acetylglucosaminyltransferase [Flavobacteriaceae bacterium]
MKKLKFILSGGGTAGHIYPAIAIADELKKRHPNAEFLFVGAKDRMEMQKVPAAGYAIKGLWISGLQRKLTVKNLLFPLKLIDSLLKAKKIIGEFKPDLAIGTGGFASGPILRAAQKRAIPTLIQEQNSYAGITNKWLAKNASKICVAYENMQEYFPEEKIVVTGNPVRSDLLEVNSKRKEAISFFKLKADQKTLLVLGGSLGAKRINEITAAHVAFFKNRHVQVVWQCGKLYYQDYSKYNRETDIQVHRFIDRMDLAYAAADLIISRAGASAVSELCVVGKPTMLIPSPNVAEDHQTKNARALADRNAAVVIKESELEEKFKNELENMLTSENRGKQLSENIKEMAKPEATKDIVDEIDKLINEK